jgi:C_GCAxxG_C_C family probable redox protein
VARPEAVRRSSAPRITASLAHRCEWTLIVLNDLDRGIMGKVGSRLQEWLDHVKDQTTSTGSGRRAVDRSETAVQMFDQEFSCSQSVFSAYADPADIPRETALRVASGFGGGLARTGETCGAVTGAIMALGLRHCGVPATDPLGKQQAYPPVQDFLARFKARHGSIVCRELLGCDLGTPEGLQSARDQGLFKSRCPAFVRTAAEILEELL